MMRTFRLLFHYINIIVVVLFHVLRQCECPSESGNPIIKEFESNRATYIAEDHKRIMKELEKAQKNMKHDPGLGFPVVEVTGEAAKVLRHIMFMNRLSPPNSLRAAEMSAKNEFSLWLDNSPGRKCSIEMTLKAVKNVKFPSMDLQAHRPVDREAIGAMEFDNLEDEIKVKWEGLVRNQALRVDIPVIMDYFAKEDEDAEIMVKGCVFKGAYTDQGYKYECFFNPRVLRWKVGPPAEMQITINNDKPLTLAVPDGRNRKFPVQIHNNLVTKNEYFQFFFLPHIEQMESSPFDYFWGMQWKSRNGIRQRGGGFTRKKWKPLLMQRGHPKAPFFEHAKYWPYNLCHQLTIIPREEQKLHEIALAIEDIAEVWHSTEQSLFTIGRGAEIDVTGIRMRNSMRELIQEKVCDPRKIKRSSPFPKICNGEVTADTDPTVKTTYSDNEGPTIEQRKDKDCGVWPKEFQFLVNHRTSGKRKIWYKVHPHVPERTAITLLFGWFAGKLEGTVPMLNDRIMSPALDGEQSQHSSFWLKNQFVFVSSKNSGKQLTLKCSNSAEIGETKCCRVRLPIKSFNTKSNHEEDFDLLVIAPTEYIQLKDYRPMGSTANRLKFRKAGGYLGGILARSQHFCYTPLQYGKHQIRFEIVEACKFMDRHCQTLGMDEKKKTIGRNKPNIMPPMDFKPPKPFTTMSSPIPLEKIKIEIVGNFESGMTTQVINQEWFKIKVIFTEEIMSDVVLRALSPKLEFEPKGTGSIGGELYFKAGDRGTGVWRARADEDCPNPYRIIIINYQVVVDDLMMWEIPTPSFIQVAPSEQDVEVGDDSNLNDSVLCNLPEEICMTNDVICGTPAEIAHEMTCTRYPELTECGGGPPVKMKANKTEETFKLLLIIAMWSVGGLMMFTVLYRNFCGGDSAAMKALQTQMSDLNQSIKRAKVPADAVDASEFLELAGFDEDHVFSRRNPDPIVLAEAQMALTKMLGAIKAK